MSRYTGPKLKVIRRLGELPGLSTKSSNKPHPPGQHGQQSKKPSPYAIRLLEKQKLRYNYGIGEKQLFNYLKRARKQNRSTAQVLLELLEMRLDNILFRVGYAKSIDAAKQRISHRHIKVNNQKISIPSYECKINDRITFVQSNDQKFFDNPKFTTLKTCIEINQVEKYISINKKIERTEILLKLDELLIIEYYSKN